MKLQKAIFILSLLGILLIIFLSQTTKQTYSGTIESIHHSNNKIIIQLQNTTTELIIFDTSLINLKKGNKIKFQGRQDIYKNQTQIIIDKLYKKNKLLFKT